MLQRSCRNPLFWVSMSAFLWFGIIRWWSEIVTLKCLRIIQFRYLLRLWKVIHLAPTVTKDIQIIYAFLRALQSYRKSLDVNNSNTQEHLEHSVKAMDNIGHILHGLDEGACLVYTASIETNRFYRLLRQTLFCQYENNSPPETLVRQWATSSGKGWRVEFIIFDNHLLNCR